MHKMNKEAYRIGGNTYSESVAIATRVEQLQSWTAQVHYLI